MVVNITPIFTCIEVLKWMIDHTDGHKCLINDEKGERVIFFLPTEFHKNYKLRDPEEQFNIEFVVNFYEFHDTSQLMASWWKEDKKFTKWSNG
jgi:hypothetical protein